MIGIANFYITLKKGLGTKGDQPAMELPGYLNRFDFDGGSTGRNKSNWSGSDDDISASDSLKKYKNKMQGRVLDGNSVASSENIHSECDSGLGSASDSGRGKSDNSDKSDKDGSSSENEKTPEEMENIKRWQRKHAIAIQHRRMRKLQRMELVKMMEREIEESQTERIHAIPIFVNFWRSRK